MFLRFRFEAILLVFVLLWTCALPIAAQDDELSDEAADPVKLFELGQDAHSKKQYEQALELYEEAIKLRPEFPEAEFQRASAYAALSRTTEAERALRRAIELRPAWALPHAALGLMLARAAEGREREAERALSRAIELDAKNLQALRGLAELRTRAGDAAGAVALWRRATELDGGDASLWLARANAERAAEDAASAMKSYERALAILPSSAEARLNRAALLVETGETERAVEEIRALEGAARSDHKLALGIANLYALAGREEEARRVFASLPDEVKASEEGRTLRAALDARCEDAPDSVAALERLIESEPKNARALACLGNALRTSSPERSLALYRRAVELEPRNADYATGYAAALVQLKRLEEAASVLQRVVSAAPDHYAAHANLAAALYGLKLYKQAIVEYKWIDRARPDLAVVHFFIGSAHDHLGEYEEALRAYETFLARADPQANQMEMEKVKLRLPSLLNQIKRGEGVKAGRKAKKR